jgi:2-desacetyl-2-hydroxyethyl bacteriochlorophyllide A dehydrogenase
MKVAVYEGARKITLQERPDPKAAPGEVIVKIQYCGICGTDVHAYLHEGLIAPGLVLGHENVGTISEVGNGVKGWQVGDRVVAGPPGPCGECYYCRHGQGTICMHGFERTNGLSPGNDGGNAEYMRVKDPGGMLVKIPDHLSFEDAVLTDTLGVAFRGIRESRFRLGDNVVVVGAGAIGLSAVQLLKIAGARHITVLNRSAGKRELALTLGADLALNPVAEGDGLREKVMAMYDGVGADICFECAGNGEAARTAVGLVKSGGQVLVLGVGGDPIPVPEAELVVREIDLRATLAYDNEEMHLVVDFLAQGRINTKGIITDIIGLDDIVEKGYERLAASSDPVKIVVAPQR